MKRKMGVLAGVMIGCVIVGMFGCKSDSANPYGTNLAPSTVPPNTVVMSASSFSPASLTVSRGTTVTWRNDSGYSYVNE